MKGKLRKTPQNNLLPNLIKMLVIYINNNANKENK